MPAYIVVDIDVHDPETYEEYKKLVAGNIEAHGGKYLARGGKTEVLEGDWVPKRFVITEFPDVDRAKAWLNSADYEPIKRIRHKSARTNMVVVEGV